MAEALTPLLVILGPTASGKTSLGIEVAEALGGEIVSADAFAVYRGFDIGTDKPSKKDRERIRHHVVDIADGGQRFSAGAFAEAAHAAIADITRRGATAIVVGGTHFYIRALLLGLFPSPPRDPVVGARLAEEWSDNAPEVFRRLQATDPDSAERIGPHDRQRILRALEVYELTGEPMTTHWQKHKPPPKYDPLLVAPNRSRDDLYARIGKRADSLFASGLVEEVQRILASGVPIDAHALKAIGYREVVELLQGRCDLEKAVEDTKRSSRKFAKRQITWLRGLHEGTLHWVPPADDGGVPAVIDLWDEHTKKRRER